MQYRVGEMFGTRQLVKVIGVAGETDSRKVGGVGRDGAGVCAVAEPVRSVGSVAGIDIMQRTCRLETKEVAVRWVVTA